MLLLLAGCGGGTGGMASTPTPAPAPAPAPTNSTLTNLKYSQSFSNDATSLAGTWDLTTGTGIDGATAKERLTIEYDAETGSYTVSSNGRSLTVGSGDITSQDDYDTVYSKSDATGTDYLTLVKQPYSGGPQTQYVGMGFWQRIELHGSSQDTRYKAFTYGLPTPVGALPRTGAADYGIDIFGIVTKPGEEPSTVQGRGQFSVDFAQGIFSADGSFAQFGLVTGSQISGGGLELHGSGLISSDATFAGGAAIYSTFGRAGGSMAGRFYGPTAQEVGASFEASDSSGFAAVGSFIGREDSSLPRANLTFANISSDQIFYTRYDQYSIGNLHWLNSETFDFAGYSSDMGGGRFTVDDKVASANPNFTTYRKHVSDGYGEQDVVLELYKPGAANTELPLTYASFGHWAGTRTGPTSDAYFTYGFPTGDYLLAARTGTAHYDGIAYASGLNSDATASFDATGTSNFDVDFTSATFSGSLALAGSERGTGRSIDFGSFDLDGTVAAWASVLTGDVMRNGNSLGAYYAQFFGPDAQELAGTFFFTAPAAVDGKDVGLKGVTAAVRK